MKIVKLTKGYETIVDDETYKWARHWKWLANVKKPGLVYAVCNLFQNNKTYHVYLHQLILGPAAIGKITDHKNGNTLDNRKENLHAGTYRHNSQNKECHRAGKLVGATFKKKLNRWQARIVIDKVRKSLGFFKTEQEAHDAYMKAFNEIHT
jgi:hypothetical protein